MRTMSRAALLCLSLCFSGFAAAQITCTTSGEPPLVQAEGLAERIGDILIDCHGAPNVALSANFTVSLDTSVTNTLSSGSTLTGILFTADSGAGPQPTLVQPQLVLPNALVFNGVNFAFSPQGEVAFRIAGVRANAAMIPAGGQIVASIAINGADLALTMSQLDVGTPEPSLFIHFADTLVCAQSGSPLPSTLDFTDLIAAGTALASTRFTEGFAGALQPLSGWANFNAQTGSRVIVQYSGFPGDASLYVPSVIAGSDAVQPTAGGDFGLPASGGAYAPSLNGSMLLALVAGADASGAGGAPVYRPGAIGSGTVTFNAVSQVPLVNGSGYAVFEVVDANPSTNEFAQFPTFMGLPPDGNRAPSETSEAVFLAPLSTTGTASSTAPVPRFTAVEPEDDCAIHGECISPNPLLSVDTTALQYNAVEGSQPEQQSFVVHNAGGGQMPWTVSVTYGNGSGWLRLDTGGATNTYTVDVFALAAQLSPGTYNASIAVDAGAAGKATVAITMTVTANPNLHPPSGPGSGNPPPPAVPTIGNVLNAASFLAVPVVPGSLTTIMGTNFSGSQVSATFNALPATILFSNATQINLLVPAALAAGSPAQLVVTAGGVASTPTPVQVAPFEPGIFPGAILNQDLTVNSASQGAAPGSIIALWATGLSGQGTITGHIADRDIPDPDYAGPAPGFPGVQQINLTIPADLPAMTTEVYVCGNAGTPVCSPPVPLTIK